MFHSRADTVFTLGGDTLRTQRFPRVRVLCAPPSESRRFRGPRSERVEEEEEGKTFLSLYSFFFLLALLLLLSVVAFVFITCAGGRLYNYSTDSHTTRDTPITLPKCRALDRKYSLTLTAVSTPLCRHRCRHHCRHHCRSTLVRNEGRRFAHRHFLTRLLASHCQTLSTVADRARSLPPACIRRPRTPGPPSRVAGPASP